MILLKRFWNILRSGNNTARPRVEQAMSLMAQSRFFSDFALRRAICPDKRTTAVWV
jgi:hypothetical protein